METHKLVQEVLRSLPPGWAEISETSDQFPIVGIELPKAGNTFLAVQIKAPWLIHEFYEELTPEEQQHFHTTYTLCYVSGHTGFSLDYYVGAELPVIAKMVEAIPLDSVAECPSAIKAVAIGGSPLVFWNEKLLTDNTAAANLSALLQKTACDDQ